MRFPKHMTCAWSWSIEYGDGGYTINIEKGHPAWFTFEQFVMHLPTRVTQKIINTAWYQKRADLYKMEIMRWECSDQEAMVLCRDLWAVCTGPDSIFENELAEGGEDE